MTVFTDIDFDTTPVASDVEYPCRTCGREAGPYSGRGPKPKLCAEHRKTTSGRKARVTGNAEKLAAQAATVLTQVNTMLAIAMAGVGFFATGSAINQANEDFTDAAYQALLVDEDFCRSIIQTGGKSAKLSLALAYGALGMRVAPVLKDELSRKKSAREAKRAAEDDTTEIPVTV